MRFSLLLLLIALPGMLSTGCAPSLPFFTETYRASIGEQELSTRMLHLSMSVEFRSVRTLDSAEGLTSSIKKPIHRILKIASETPGRILKQGNGWLSVDFGQGIVLPFLRRERDGVYATAGWGTITIADERYDIVVGIVTGEDIELRVEP